VLVNAWLDALCGKRVFGRCRCHRWMLAASSQFTLGRKLPCDQKVSRGKISASGLHEHTLLPFNSASVSYTEHSAFRGVDRQAHSRAKHACLESKQIAQEYLFQQFHFVISCLL